MLLNGRRPPSSGIETVDQARANVDWTKAPHRIRHDRHYDALLDVWCDVLTEYKNNEKAEAENLNKQREEQRRQRAISRAAKIA